MNPKYEYLKKASLNKGRQKKRRQKKAGWAGQKDRLKKAVKAQQDRAGQGHHLI